jgi:hypothetical protein
MTMRMTIENKTGCVIFQREFNDESEYLMLYSDPSGRFLSKGYAKPKGRGFIKAIRKSAQEWAKRQDLPGFLQDLRLLLIQECIKTGNIKAQLCLQADTFIFDPDNLLSCFTEARKGVIKDIKEKYGEESGFLLFHIAWESMLAMIRRLKEEFSQVQTVWEYPAYAFNNNEIKAILEWLFRRL